MPISAIDGQDGEDQLSSCLPPCSCPVAIVLRALAVSDAKHPLHGVPHAGVGGSAIELQLGLAVPAKRTELCSSINFFRGIGCSS